MSLEDDVDETITSPYFAAGNEGRDKDALSPTIKGYEEVVENQSKPPERKDTVQLDFQNTVLPPIPTRVPQRHSANQLMSSDSKADVDMTPRCGNDFCKTPKSVVRDSHIGPNGELLCQNCNNRYKRNPNKWQKGLRMDNRSERRCENDKCSTPKSPVSPGATGPNGESLCTACHQRYLRQCRSTLPRDSDSWKDSIEGRSRKGVKGTRRKAALSERLDSSDSDDDEPLVPKRDETRRGTRVQSRVPDKDRCQNCFDYALNCSRRNGNPCDQC